LSAAEPGRDKPRGSEGEDERGGREDGASVKEGEADPGEGLGLGLSDGAKGGESVCQRDGEGEPKEGRGGFSWRRRRDERGDEEIGGEEVDRGAFEATEGEVEAAFASATEAAEGREEERPEEPGDAEEPGEGVHLSYGDDSRSLRSMIRLMIAAMSSGGGRPSR